MYTISYEKYLHSLLVNLEHRAGVYIYFNTFKHKLLSSLHKRSIILSSVAPGHIELLRGLTRACDTKGYPKVKLGNVMYSIYFNKSKQILGY